MKILINFIFLIYLTVINLVTTFYSKTLSNSNMFQITDSCYQYTTT